MGARFFPPVQTGPGAHPASCKMGTGSFPGVKSVRSVTLIPHPLLVPCSRKGRAIPLLPLWAVRPVQSLSACTRVHFTFNPLNAEFKPICYLLALLAHHFLRLSRIRLKSLTLRLLMFYIYIYIYIYMEQLFLMFLDHTQRRSTVGRTPLDECMI